MPYNRGKKFPADPLQTAEVIKLLRGCQPRGRQRAQVLVALQLRAIIVVLWRTGLRISELLALEISDLMRADGAIYVRRGKGGKPRIVVMDTWGWVELDRWLEVRLVELPPGPIFCVLRGKTRGQKLDQSLVREHLRIAARSALPGRRVNPHNFRHGFTVSARKDGVDLLALQRQLGHARLDVTEVYVRSIDPLDVLKPIGDRPTPELPPDLLYDLI